MKIPRSTARRLPLYYRCLAEMRERGVPVVSSRALSSKAGVEAAIIRKDLACFGELGKRGVGYNVDFLYREVGRILRIEEERELVVIGGGKLGQAWVEYLARYGGNFRVAAVFDAAPAEAERVLPGVQVLPLGELTAFVRARGISLAVLAVKAEEARSVVGELVRAGVKGILNFAPITLDVPPDVRVVDCDFSSKLHSLICSLGGGEGRAVLNRH
ncbi:MAG: redox-sensing transcriptional repressor Rex [Bacillota bacterium]